MRANETAPAAYQHLCHPSSRMNSSLEECYNAQFL
jgi:hypothetical protein